MDSKLDESTGETSTENVLSFSVNGVATTHKSRKCETGQHSETSNVLSMNSSCDSSSENAKWKPSSGISDASATDLASQNSGLMEIPSPKSMDDADHSVKDGKSIPQVNKSKDLEEDSRIRLRRGLLECRDEHLNPMLAKEVVCDILHVDLPADASNSGEENEDVDKSMKSSVLPDTKDNCAQSHLMDEGDDSDIVEQDVKVCDICGDAGREDLLAICCRCSDGAEHTYCMREMLDKVPEGNWLCEECRYDEEMKNQGQDKVVRVDVAEKNYSSSKASGENSNICLKSEAKGADEVDKISKDRSNMKILGKRHRDDVEVSSSAKKQAIESVLGSPKRSTASSGASLSRDNSFRHLERGKEKLTHQSSSGALLVNDDIESARAPPTGPRMQTPRGTFLKSSSFSSSNAKPKVKLVDEVVPPKQKSVRELSPLDTKEGLGKSLGKSMSFKTISSSRLGTGESKVKMLSPNFSHNQDNKGFKHTKERSLFERKSSFKSERPFLNSPRVSSAISTSKSDTKLACRGETALSSIGNNHQSKAVQSDSKSTALSKSSSLVSRRASDVPVSLGEVKRQSSVVNELSGCEQKLSPKDDSLISYIAEKLTHNPNESPLDGSSQPTVNLGEKMRDNGNRSKQNIAIGGRTDISQKCKEVGHLTQFCPIDGLPPDVATAKCSREVTNGSNDLKAAIEAARLRKPGICRKYRVADQSNDVPQASKNSEVVSQDQSSSSISRKNMSAGEANEENTAVRYSTDSCKQEAAENMKQFTSLYMETSTSRTGDGGPVVPCDGKTSIRDLSYHFPAAISVMWKMLAIPEHEFIWQGNFEVCRSVKVEFCDGIQAHLSTCASPKVLEAANRFPQKIVLNEVPRLSTWPTQFQEYGVREDNVALYFFAKDVDSYEKSYKILLENMIKHDLALKGIIDGVELLIFPSTQLPEKSQRWNMLFFLWGVFRGRKTSCSQQMPGFPKQSVTQQDIPTAIMSLPENICSLGPIDKDLSSDAAFIAEVPASEDGYGVSGVPSLIRMEDSKQINLFSLESSSMKSCPEIRCTEGGPDENCKLENGEVQASVQGSGRSVSSRSECMAVRQDTSPAGCDVPSSQIIAEGIVSNKMTSGTYQVNHGKNLGEGSNKEEAPLKRDTVTKEPITEDLNTRLLKQRKNLHEDSVMISEATSAGASQTILIDDDEDEDVIVLSASKRQKTGSDGLSGSNDRSSSSNDGFTSRIHAVPSGSPVKNRRDEACDRIAHPEFGNAERYFFPVNLHPVKDVGLVNKSMPWRMHPLEDQLHDRTPNLELALGAETELPTQGIPSFLVDKKVVQDHHLGKVAKEEEDDGSGSLSLSLSFPFPDEQHTTSISKTEQLRTERQHVNTSLLLFGGIGDK